MKRPDGIILSISGSKLTNEEKSFFKETNPFGFVLFRRNFRDRYQLKKLISELKQLTKSNSPLVFVDQEVERFKGLVTMSLLNSHLKVFLEIFLKK